MKVLSVSARLMSWSRPLVAVKTMKAIAAKAATMSVTALNTDKGR
jgi:hypothetical protein